MKKMTLKNVDLKLNRFVKNFLYIDYLLEQQMIDRFSIVEKVRIMKEKDTKKGIKSLYSERLADEILKRLVYEDVLRLNVDKGLYYYKCGLHYENFRNAIYELNHYDYLLGDLKK